MWRLFLYWSIFWAESWGQLMNFDLVMGLALLAIFVVLLFVGLPNKDGVSPRF